MKKKSLIIGVTALLVFGLLGSSVLAFRYFKSREAQKPSLTPAQIAQQFSDHHPELVSTPSAELKAASASATASSSAKPQLSLAEMTKLYGPCVKLPTLMYHHVQDLVQAKAAGHAQLTVGTPYFQKHLEYLVQKKYTVVKMSDLIAFFDQGKALPAKPIMLTFDDGYDDFGTDAAPLLKQFNFAGTQFLPTGLLENPGYLKWSSVSDLAQGGQILMANHTWSHRSMDSKKDVIDKEITSAQQALTSRGYDSPPVFAYPYGTTSKEAEKILADKKYLLAFTTQHGDILCKGQRLLLPRIRVGNLPLSRYGL